MLWTAVQNFNRDNKWNHYYWELHSVDNNDNNKNSQPGKEKKEPAKHMHPTKKNPNRIGQRPNI